MTFTKAQVILKNACDLIILSTDKPCPIVVEALPSQPNLTLRFDATYDTGAYYVRHFFDIEPEIINTR